MGVQAYLCGLVISSSASKVVSLIMAVLIGLSCPHRDNSLLLSKIARREPPHFRNIADKCFYVALAPALLSFIMFLAIVLYLLY